MATSSPIIVWCHPRSVSSAFERAFMQRTDTRSYHEPLSMPFYYGQERACRRYSDEACQATSEGKYWSSTVEQTLRDLLAETEAGTEDKVTVGQREGKEGCRYIFIKDMAQYVFAASALKTLHPDSTVYKHNEGQAPISLTDPLANPTVLPIDLLRRFKHTFLMRTPEKSVASYWKCVQDGAAGFEYFDAAEAGYAELRILYDWIANPQSTFHTARESDLSHTLPGQVQAQPMPPPLVDASDLLASPDDVVARYCAAIGVPFEPGMLTWESGKVNAFASWQGYHTAAENSTGFKREDKPAQSTRKRVDSVDSTGSQEQSHSTAADTAAPNTTAKETSKPAQPAEVRDAIRANLDTYNYLYSLRTIRTKSNDA